MREIISVENYLFDVLCLLSTQKEKQKKNKLT